jgi:nicotinamide mononucleotide transporter
VFSQATGCRPGHKIAGEPALSLNTILHNIWAGIVGASWLDPVNLVLGVLGVWLMVKRSLWAFPIGLVAVAVQGVLFFRTRIYADATLQIFFFVALAWGWWHWVRAKGDAAELPVTAMSTRERVVVVLLTAAATVAWALAARRWTNSIMPWRDAAIAMLQVAGQILQSRKKLECWALFSVANGIAIPAYWSAELAFTAFLFGLYLVLGLIGWREWAWAMKKQHAHG